MNDKAEPTNPTRQDDRDKGPAATGGRSKKNKAKGGQNTARSFGSSRDALQLCMSRSKAPEFSPEPCPFGDSCKFEHDLRKYLKEGKREDLSIFESKCPVWEARGTCDAGWRCRFACGHSREITHVDGRKELILSEDVRKAGDRPVAATGDDATPGVVNIVSAQDKIKLRKHQIKTIKADRYNEWLNKFTTWAEGQQSQSHKGQNGSDDAGEDAIKDNRAQYTEPPFLPSEKRRIYYGSETPCLAPLTTQGSLPFRRLCVELGAQVTWSEMAMGLPLVQGEKPEWALMKAHESELLPPKFNPKDKIVKGYDNSKDIRFGAQIAANKPWLALKTVEVITALCPNIRAIDLNCGCPVDLVYRQGAGSALLESPAKLEKILKGMNAVSQDIPITVKVRMGTKDNKPTARKLVERLAFGGPEAIEHNQGPCGVAAITLHGRSRQQRYTKTADWNYISECAALIKDYNAKRDGLTDTVREPDARHLSSSNGSHIYFIGNGDCYSHIDYYDHMQNANVDSVLIARGALIKPWIFEEIEQGQYLDKSATERLQYVEKFVKNGLEAWGSDEIGVGNTRRFLLEWLSFTCRYVPIGLLEHLPPHINDRPPQFRGRSDMETLLASDNYKDWIKITEMYLGPVHPDFTFVPKHKSNAYETEEVEG